MKIRDIPVIDAHNSVVVRPSKHFRVLTNDNPHMEMTLEMERQYIAAHMDQLIAAEEELSFGALREKFQVRLANNVYQESLQLVEAIKATGIPVTSVPEAINSLENIYYADQVFVTDTGKYYQSADNLCFIPAYFKNISRRGEEEMVIEHARQLGATIQYLDDGKIFFEAGDLLQTPGRALFLVGYGFRTEKKSCDLIQAISRFKVIPIQLIQSQFYHLDSCVLPLPNDALVLYEGEYVRSQQGRIIYDSEGLPQVLKGSETMSLESRISIHATFESEKIWFLTKQEALSFAANASIIKSFKDNRYKMFVSTESFQEESKNRIMDLTEGLMDIIEVPYSSLHYAGGSVRCTVQEAYWHA